jgi:tryptophanyl-tRNA synthetase
MDKVYEGCRTAAIGCIECKGWAADSLWEVLEPIQERRAKYEADPKLAWDILEAGSAKARISAESTMNEVRAATNLSFEYEPPKVAAGKQ